MIYRDEKLLQHKGVQIIVRYTQGYFLYDSLAWNIIKVDSTL